MAQINILLRILNALGANINPATEEKQDALLAKLPSALSSDRVKVETQHIQSLTEAQLAAAGLATETTAETIAAIVNASLNVALGTRATETSLLDAIAKLNDIKNACEAIAIDADTISLNADTINLNTDQLEAILQQVRDHLPAALGQQLSAASMAVVLSTQQEAIFATIAGLLTDIKAGLGQQADAAATTDAGTFSLIALVKRQLQQFAGYLSRFRSVQDAIVNMIDNPSIETTADIGGGVNWSPSYTGANPSLTLARTLVTDALDGSYVGRLTQGVAAVGSSRIQWGHRDQGRYRVVPGRLYVFEVGFRARRQLANVFLSAHFFQTIGSDVGATALASAPIPQVAHTHWSALRFEVVAPAGASFAALSVACDSLAAATGDLFDVDDVRFFEAKVPTTGQLPTTLHFDRSKVADRFTGDEYLEDQAGAGGVLTFTFANAPDIAFVFPDLLTCRAAFSVTPTATKGVRCDAGVATPVILSGQTALKVFAPAGTSVSVWGFRYS